MNYFQTLTIQVTVRHLLTFVVFLQKIVKYVSLYPTMNVMKGTHWHHSLTLPLPFLASLNRWGNFLSFSEPFISGPVKACL